MIDRRGQTWEVHGTLYTVVGPPKAYPREFEPDWVQHPAIDTETGAAEWLLEADGLETLEELAVRVPDVYRRVA